MFAYANVKIDKEILLHVLGPAMIVVAVMSFFMSVGLGALLSPLSLFSMCVFAATAV